MHWMSKVTDILPEIEKSIEAHFKDVTFVRTKAKEGEVWIHPKYPWYHLSQSKEDFIASVLARLERDVKDLKEVQYCNQRIVTFLIDGEGGTCLLFGSQIRGM